MEVMGELTPETFSELDKIFPLADFHQIGTYKNGDGLAVIIEGRSKRLIVLFKGADCSHKAQDAALHAFEDFKNPETP
jgi:hypothetical protein